MKAVIIAAGIGKRMRPLTDSLPKCMLNFNGKPLLQKHFELLHSCGIDDISVVRGYMAGKISLSGAKFYDNDRYEYNNILNSLMYAEPQINKDMVITYSDIYYTKEVLAKLIQSPFDISVIGDLNWRKAYVNRDGHPESEAESIQLGADNKVAKIGKRIEKGSAQAEFMGMMKLSEKGCGIFKETFHSSKKRFWGNPFHEADVFEKAYLTDMIQELVDAKIDVHCVSIQGGCVEIDTLQDYENVKSLFNKV